MKAQSDAYPPGGFRQIVKNMQSRIFHKNCRHMQSIKETSFLNFCLLGIGMEWYTKDGNNHLKIPPKQRFGYPYLFALTYYMYLVYLDDIFYGSLPTFQSCSHFRHTHHR
jgi:hypothetical protein